MEGACKIVKQARQYRDGKRRGRKKGRKGKREMELERPEGSKAFNFFKAACRVVRGERLRDSNLASAMQTM